MEDAVQWLAPALAPVSLATTPPGELDREALAHLVLDTGGFLCVVLATLALQQLETPRAFAFPDLVERCLAAPTPAPSAHGLVLARLHNGVGNQVFQYLFARLLADSVGWPLVSTLVDPAVPNEVPKVTQGQTTWGLPVNSVEGFETFGRLFPHAPRHVRLPATRSANTSAWAERCLAAPEQQVVSDRPFDTRRRRKPLLSQLLDVLVASTDRRSGRAPFHLCVKTIGYFQNVDLFLHHQRFVRTWLDTTAPPPLSASTRHAVIGPDDVTVHIRCCLFIGMCKQLVLPLEYYSFVLTELLHRRPRTVWLVTTDKCAKSSLVQQLQQAFPCHLVPPLPGATPGSAGGKHSGHVLSEIHADFLFLQHSRTLVLGKSTFAFWAGQLSNATEIHVPSFDSARAGAASLFSRTEQAPPEFSSSPAVGASTPWYQRADPRYRYHNPVRGAWFGTVDGHTGETTWGFHREIARPVFDLRP